MPGSGREAGQVPEKSGLVQPEVERERPARALGAQPDRLEAARSTRARARSAIATPASPSARAAERVPAEVRRAPRLHGRVARRGARNALAERASGKRQARPPW